MTAGEQIIYKHHREMWELGEQIKELGEQNKELGEQNKELGEQNKEFGEKIKELRENAKKDKEATARILKDALVPIDIIMKSTGLSLEQIEAL